MKEETRKILMNTQKLYVLFYDTKDNHFTNRLELILADGIGTYRTVGTPPHTLQALDSQNVWHHIPLHNVKDWFVK